MVASVVEMLFARSPQYKFKKPKTIDLQYKGRFCVRNGSVTPREEGSAKQTQVMLLGGWSTDDVKAKAYLVSIKWSRCWTVPREKGASNL